MASWAPSPGLHRHWRHHEAGRPPSVAAGDDTGHATLDIRVDSPARMSPSRHLLCLMRASRCPTDSTVSISRPPPWMVLRRRSIGVPPRTAYLSVSSLRDIAATLGGMVRQECFCQTEATLNKFGDVHHDQRRRRRYEVHRRPWSYVVGEPVTPGDNKFLLVWTGTPEGPTSSAAATSYPGPAWFDCHQQGNP